MSVDLFDTSVARMPREHRCLSGAPEGEARCVHLCNGLDPKRDGGMVPSILGMTGALGRLGREVRIVTPTPSRLAPGAMPPGVPLYGSETDFEQQARSAGVLHLHGLWQAQTRRGSRVARAGRIPYV